jgi:endonuclease/exonuclease/phosphatase family metal-dependent hydrolase
MKELESGSFLTTPFPRVWPDTMRVVSWNVNRGLRLDGILDFLTRSRADVILLQETDVNARRTASRNIPRKIAQALGMNYIFGCEFEELSQGSRINPAYHGQTTLSHLPLSHPRILRFRDQSKFWRPRWFVPPIQCLQRRLGGRMALICRVSLGGRHLLLYNAHLESRGSDELRMGQLSEMLSEVSQHPVETPVLMAGDFNFDLSCGPAASVIAETGANNLFAFLERPGTAIRNRRANPVAIDWMLTRGALAASNVEIHVSVTVSDHFPLSMQLRLL